MQKVSILIPHYKTLELTKLCLRLVRKFTDLSLAKIIVIDNGSQDASTEYLRGLKWIELIERSKVAGERGHVAHSHALDLALEKVNTPFVLSIHTDTLVKRSDWLPFLLQHIEGDENIVGVGSWKLEPRPWWKKIFKSIENVFQSIYSHQTRQKNYYLRSHCALYRTGVLRKHQLKFLMGEGVAGMDMHRVLIEKGYHTKFLSSEELLPYLDHVNHATMILNPEFDVSQRAVRKGRKRLTQQLSSVDMEKILADDLLDQ